MGHINLINLNSFLKLGYFLDYHNPRFSFDIKDVDKSIYESASESELIDKGVILLKKAITDCYANNVQHVVPISGGLDSRYILAGLLEHTESSNIHTYTFGTPGTWDYEIGNGLAKKYGTIHHSLPMIAGRVTRDELIDVSQRMDHQAVLFHHPSIQAVDKFSSDGQHWSGWLGGEISGSHLPSKASTSLAEGMATFLKKNTFVKSISITNIEDSSYETYLLDNDVCGKKLCYEEALDFKNRQIKYIAPHVLLKKYKYNLPFLCPELLNFMLSIPDKFRIEKYLYKKMLITAFPQDFSYPTKEMFGLPLDSSKPAFLLKRVQTRLSREFNKIYPLFIDKSINYIDFNTAIRKREDLQSIVYTSINDLKQRGIVDWIDIDSIWKRHMNKKANHADALLVLTSLEIHLKAGKKIST